MPTIAVGYRKELFFMSDKEELKGGIIFTNLDGLASLFEKLSEDLKTAQKDCDAINDYDIKFKIAP
jgi:hypothetical protein